MTTRIKRRYQAPAIKKATAFLVSGSRQAIQHIADSFPQDATLQQNVRAYDLKGGLKDRGAMLELQDKELALKIFEGYHGSESPVILWAKHLSDMSEIHQIPFEESVRLVKLMNEEATKDPPKHLPRTKAGLLRSTPGLTTGKALAASGK